MKVVDTVTAPPKVMAPAVLLNTTVGAVVVPDTVVLLLFVNVKLLTLRLPPIETVPPVPPFTVRVLLLPVTLLDVVMLAPAGVPPLFVVSSTVFAVNVAGPVSPIVPPEVVILPPRLIAELPV